MKIEFSELAAKILEILPDAGFEEDNCGQLVVYTALYPKLGKKDVWETKEEASDE